MDKKVENMINDEITARVVLVIDDKGQQLGQMSKDDAIAKAYDKGLDLVCVAPNAAVPVCKFMDYAKYRYDQNKKAREAKKNQHIVEIKEVRLSPTIATGDFEVKLSAARAFLENGDKVKVTCRFRGRMIEQANATKEKFLTFAGKLEEISTIDQQPILDGRNMSMLISPKNNKKKN